MAATLTPTTTGAPRAQVPPLYGTPRNPERATYGQEVDGVAIRLGKPLMPWQQHAADVALEIDPATGDLYYDEVVITVPRQSGKTTLLLAVMLWRCVIFARRLADRQVVTYLAQMGKSARRKLEREFIPLLRRAPGFTQVPHSRARPTKPTEFKPSLNNGNEHILFGTDSYLQVEAPGEKGSHGDVLDMPVIDEAFAHESDAVEQAVDAANITRRSAQTWVISTAGNERSSYLWLKVLAGRKACETGEHGRTCYLEWGIPMDADWDDEATWWEYLPALGHTISVDKLRARLAKARRNPDIADEEGLEPGIPGFRRGYLNQWVKFPKVGEQTDHRLITAEAWNAWIDRASTVAGTLVLGVSVAHDGLAATVFIAGRRADGKAHLETLAHEPGTWWLETTLREMVSAHQPTAVAWHSAGPTRQVAPAIERAVATGRDVQNVKLSGLEWSAACAAFATAVKDGAVRHLGDTAVEDAISGVIVRDVGQGWEWGLRESRSDATPLIAATAALRALEAIPAVVKPRVFAY